MANQPSRLAGAMPVFVCSRSRERDARCSRDTQQHLQRINTPTRRESAQPQTGPSLQSAHSRPEIDANTRHHCTATDRPVSTVSTQQAGDRRQQYTRHDGERAGMRWWAQLTCSSWCQPSPRAQSRSPQIIETGLCCQSACCPTWLMRVCLDTADGPVLVEAVGTSALSLSPVWHGRLRTSHHTMETVDTSSVFTGCELASGSGLVFRLELCPPCRAGDAVISSDTKETESLRLLLRACSFGFPVLVVR
eukprot:1827909-Prymnesium_polylepis.1